MEVLAAVLGLAVPIALAATLLRAAGAGPIGSIGLVAASAALNSIWPLGGGMVVDGAYRTRFAHWEWTHDAQRSRRERFLGPFGLSAITLGGFLLPLPLLVLGFWIAGPFGEVAVERGAVGALAALVIAGFARYRPEVALGKLKGDPKALSRLARVAHADGSIGNVGGIGARTVGLHEHLDAIEVLQAAVAANAPGAKEQLAKALAYLRARREGDGFPAYPGARPRADITERAQAMLDRPEGRT
jgi:hypothetical protein